MLAMRRVFLSCLVVLALAMPGCGKHEPGPGGNQDSGAAVDADSAATPASSRPAAGDDGIFPSQPLVPGVPLSPPSPMSPPLQSVPLPLQRPAAGLLVPSRQELPRSTIADTSGGGGGGTGLEELLIDSTRPEMRGGYYIFGLDYVAAITDMDNNGNFAPKPSFSAAADVI